MFCQDKPIFISLSPNTEKDDVFLALKLILQPWKWKISINKSAAKTLENTFKQYLGIKHAFTFNSGRSAFLAILNALNIEEGKEVLLQAFTCNAVVNPIIWSGFKPIFVDIDEKTLNIDPEDLEKKIGQNSKVVLVQHTFGLPADMDKILVICQKHNLILIEDCAHALGATHNSRKLGTFGQAAFFSFGRDKIISSVFGGLVVTNDDILAQKIAVFQGKCPYPSCFWILQQLLHPILTNLLIIPLFRFWGAGKCLLFLLQKSGIFSKATSKEEKKGTNPGKFPKKMPGVLAALALHQFQKLEKILIHQQEIANFYEENLKLLPAKFPPKTLGRIYLRYSLILENLNPEKILKAAKKNNIFLDDGWRKTPIMPPDTDQEKMGYVAGSCPKAEKTAKLILNLPTHINISKENAKMIVKTITNHFSGLDFKNRVAKIGGWLTEDEGIFLYEAAKKIASMKNIVEIGSWKGRSTICLAQGIKDSNFGSKIYAIDPHNGSSEHIRMFGKVDTYGEFIKNVKDAMVDEFIVPIKDSSENAAKNFDKKAGLVFIDDAHDYRHVKQDFDLWFPKLTEGGLICLHDSLAAFRVILKTLIFSKEVKNPKLIDSLTVFEKTAESRSQDCLKNILFLIYLMLFGWKGQLKLIFRGWVLD